MKKLAIIPAMAMMIYALAAGAWADSATRVEAMAKCDAAAALIKEKGLQTAVTQIGSRTGPFVWKDSYVFLMDMNGKVLAHPMAPQLTQRQDDLLHVENSDGKYLFKEFIRLAINMDQGWVDYMFPKPGEEKPVAKSTYIERVPGTQYLVGAGIYK